MTRNKDKITSGEVKSKAGVQRVTLGNTSILIDANKKYKNKITGVEKMGSELFKENGNKVIEKNNL